MAKVSIDYEFDNCEDCPYLRTSRDFGNDGRDGSTVYICKKGCFGGTDRVYGDYGESEIPTTPPYSCPFIEVSFEDITSKIMKILEGLPVSRKWVVLDKLRELI